MNGVYVKNIDKDEIRSGFLVTTDRKKIWNKEIELFLEVDRICKKYDIPYFVVYGTMIGGARHKGFVPWDDDMDVAMMRSDYMRFVQVAAQEVKSPYFLQNTYTDSRIMNWTKIMDDRTSAIEDWDADMHQGMFVDIFPLDAVSDGTKKGALIDEMCKELWMSVITPQQVAEGLRKGVSSNVAGKTLQRILEMPLQERMRVYEDFCVKHFDDSDKVAFQMSYWCNRSKPVSKTAFADITYTDFEGIKVPMPNGYDEFLTEIYGNWRVPVHSPSEHENVVMSADIPYDVMLKDINQELLQCGDYLWK